VRAWLAAGASVLLLAGCGTADLSAKAELVLKADVAKVVTAARAGNGAAVRAAVDQLRRDVTAQREAGELSEERASRVLAAASLVAVDVPVPKATPTPTPSPRPSPAAKPVVTRDRGDEHDKGKKRH
jgi:hypothetical protein